MAEMYFPFGPGPVKHALEKDFPEDIEAVVRIHTREGSVRRGRRLFAESISVVDEGFFDVFPFRFLLGDRSQALRDVSSVVISQSAAEKYFGGEEALGRTLFIEDGIRKRDFVVTGVFHDVPRTTTSDLRLDFITLVDESEFASKRWLFDYWMGLNTAVFFKLRPGAKLATLEAALPEFERRNMPPEIDEQTHFSILPLTDIRLHSGPFDDREGDIATVAASALIAALVYAIACVNFVTMAMALASERARQIALRKVLGAQRWQLALQFFGETLIWVVLALALAIGLVELFSSHLAGLLGRLPPAIPLQLWPFLIGLVLIAGLAGGAYPAFQIARVAPVQALRAGGPGVVSGGAPRLRAAFVMFQFAVAVALVAATLVVYRQSNFALAMDRGFDADGLMVVRNIYRPEAQDVSRLFKQRASALPGVVAASLSSGIPSDISGDLTSVRAPTVPSGEKISLRQTSVDPDFLAAYGIPLRAGRNFDELRPFDREPDPDEPIRGFSGLINERALDRLGFASPQDAIGKTITIRPGYRNEAPVAIIGIVPDIVMEGARQPVEPTLYTWQWDTVGNLTVQYRGISEDQLLAALERLWSEMVPEIPLRAESLERRLAALGAEESRRAALLASSATIAVIIACVGLFALVSLTAVRRRREIAIRKVLGASDGNILRLLLWQYVKPVLIAGIAVLPFVWLAMGRWLEGFAHRIQLTPTPFLTALLVAAFIALLTVAGRATAMSRTLPADALRRE